MKPMLAADADETKIRFPIIAQPKIDGVRGLNVNGRLIGRSLRQHPNKATTQYFSGDHLADLDGELVVGQPFAHDSCRVTSAALATVARDPQATWWVFDLVNWETIDHPYHKRLEALRAHVDALDDPRVCIIPSVLCDSIDELNALEAAWLAEGYEGVIIRDPDGRHKQGRSTIKQGGLLRIKRFVDAEAVVIELVDSIHPGIVGALACRDCVTSQVITVSAGGMTQAEKDCAASLIGATIKYKHFPHGAKDLPRFPTYAGIRTPTDIAA